MKELESAEDWKWYCHDIDGANRVRFDHGDGPVSYPCRVESEFVYEDNGPDRYVHTFHYRTARKCGECGHQSWEWLL